MRVKWIESLQNDSNATEKVLPVLNIFVGDCV